MDFCKLINMSARSLFYYETELVLFMSNDVAGSETLETVEINGDRFSVPFTSTPIEATP